MSRLRATDGSATVISVPSSWSNAAALVQAASRVHASRVTDGDDERSARPGLGATTAAAALKALVLRANTAGGGSL